MNNWKINIINKRTKEKTTLYNGLTEQQAERFCESWGWIYTDENNISYWLELEGTRKYKCVHCGELFEFDADDNDDYDEVLWGHIQMEHEEIFEDVQNLDTPYMLEECFEEC